MSIGQQRRRPRAAVGIVSSLVVGALLAGLGVGTGVLPTLTGSAGSTGGAAAQRAEPVPPPGPPACDAVVAGLSERDRLAQRLMVGVDAADPAGAAEIVRSWRVGGIFLGGKATALLQDDKLAAVQAATALPVTVAVDDEGGRVQRIGTLDGPMPSARRMAADMTTGQVRVLGFERGRQLRARGVTMNFAPTVDVGRQPAGSVIGDRAFSDDPEVVARYAQAFAEGQREAGVAVVLKHFPGHGHANGDSHAGRVSTPPLDRLRRDDLRPYSALVGPGRPLAGLDTGVMVGHLDVPGLTEGLPASLTPAVYRLLRDEYGFDGVVITDDLGAMKAISNQFSLPRATLAALQAGADVALSSNVTPVGPVLATLEQALAEGTLDAGDNDRAVARILAAKGVCAARS
ncbi:glycoside hydrolase family 3 N-terminal domain-containing protein [Pseudonocardia hispaniensis]|uniref:beta-N-acetylhexosaminidase n=1 Tax=Pseudonocardia hispaniensis TaxID=904933 RepID=A0ABW1J7I3_9PSEU